MSEAGAVSPPVSVILPVHNGMPYLPEAVDSILNQTYGDFELIIIDDGSTDGTADYLTTIRDPRLQVYVQERRGLAASLNRAVSLAAGMYLARQDHDDISLPERLAKQVAFLEQNPECGMVGTWAAIWEENGVTSRAHRHPMDSHTLRYELLFNNPFVHSSVLVRKSVFDQVGLYTTDPSRQPPEDYELWSRVARKFEVNNIGEILLIYREVMQSISRQQARPLLDRIVTISAENLAWYTDKGKVDRDLTDISALTNAAYHRVSPSPDLRKLISILFLAAGNLRSHCSRPNPKLNRRVWRTGLLILRNYCRYLRSGKRVPRLAGNSSRPGAD